MRLTLRTLLAYLDDMLEEGDAQILKTKIEESGIATALIARIRNSVDHPDIGALSPDAIGPLENANVMSEYLDSTLSPEQIAEIERLCLDSDTSLSEAAACHQILTVVLGQPARVSDRLRHRVYELPGSDELRAMELRSQPAADAHTPKSVARPAAHSAVEIPSEGVDDEMDLGSGSYELSSSANQCAASARPAGSVTSQPTTIRPVGPDDSGASHASTRLREAAVLDDDSGRSEAEIVAGATRAMMERSDGFGGGIRPSRITPWLVTLALAGVVLYVLGQIFAPLSKRGVRDVGPVVMEEIDNGASPIIIAEPQPTPPENTDNSSMTSDTAKETTTDQDAASVKTADAPPSNSQPLPTSEEPAVDADLAIEPETPPMVTEIAENNVTDSVKPDVAPETTSGPPDPAMVPATPIDATAVDAAEKTDMRAATPDLTKPAEDDTKAENAVPAQPPATVPVVAELAEPGALVLVRDGENWSRLLARDPKAEANNAADKPNAKMASTTTNVLSGQTIVATALFRPILVNPTGIEWTLAGPTRMKIEMNETNIPVTHLIDGRVLLASTKPKVTAALILGDRQIKVAIPEPQTVLAIELLHLRPPGANPLRAENRLPVYRVIAVQGTAMLHSSLVGNAPNAAGAKQSETVTLETGQQLQGRGVQSAAVSTVDRLPPWIDAAAKKDVLVDSAREGLMEFVSKDEPIEKSLREAMAFRRVEVAALAAETLLMLGRADVYFGGDGILNRPRQRLYWEEHVNMLRQHIASDAAAAEAVRVAIERAELADSQKLFKLLVGYTQDELIAGGDEQLVQLLDSPSMAVRVLAIENLRMIVGDTLAYRADQENANSRRNDIKKWDTRFRRGDIRYKE
jgi:hypothetical protein